MRLLVGILGLPSLQVMGQNAERIKMDGYQKWAEKRYRELGDIDLISKFTKIVSEYCDAPEDFIKAGGYHLVASLLGRFAILPNVPYGNKPNPWFILSSIPSRMRRSTVLNYVEFVYKRALSYFYNGDKDTKQKIAHSILEEGTIEGLMDHIETAYNEGITAFTIMSSEFGGILKRMTSTNYQIGVSSFLSKLKYGEEGTMYLSTRGGKKGIRHIPHGLFVTMFTSMQEPEFYITKEQVRQGLMRRLMIIYKRPADLKRWLSPLRLERADVWRLLDCYATELAEKMGILHQRRYFRLRYDDEPAVPIYITENEAINQLAKDLEMSLVEKDKKGIKVSDLDIYKLGFTEQIIELSAVRSLARFQLVEGDTLSFVVTEEDLKEAQAFHKSISSRIEEVFESISVRRQPLKIEETIEKIFEFIRRGGKSGVAKSELYRAFQIKANELESCLASLIRADRIVMITEKTGKPGKPRTRIIAKAFLTPEEIEEYKKAI